MLLFSQPFLQAQTFTTMSDGGSGLIITGWSVASGPVGALTIPTTINGQAVTAIGRQAFFFDMQITSVTFAGNNITTIPVDAFDECDALTSVILPDSVTSIEGGAFDDDLALTHIDLGNNITTLGPGAFQNCSTLVSITIPASVTEIDIGEFGGCNDLSTAIFLGNAPTTTPVADF